MSLANPAALAFLPLLDTVEDALCFYSASGDLLFRNQAFLKQFLRFEREIEARLGKIELIAVKKADLRDAFQKALQGEKTKDQFKFAQDGIAFPVSIDFIPHHEEGTVVGVLMKWHKQDGHSSANRDHLKQSLLTEDLIGYTETQIREANQPRGLGFWSMDLKTDKVVFSPQLLEDWKDTDKAQVETMSEAIERIHPEDQAPVRATLAATLLNGDNYWTEYRIFLNGEILWMESRAELSRDHLGEAIRLTGTVHDITQRKRMEAELRDSERWFRILSNFMPQMIWTADPKGLGTYFNQKWLDFVGIDQSTAIAKQTLSFVHPDDQERALNNWRHSVKTGEAFETEFRLFRASDQTYRWHLSRALPLRDETGKIVRWLGSNTDTDDLKQLQNKLEMATLSAQKAAEAKSNFLANMSHEIRTPLTAVLGFTDLMVTRELPEEKRRHYLDLIHRNAKNLSQLINDILDISKFDAGQYRIELVDFRLDQFLDELKASFEEQARLKSVALHLHIASGTPNYLKTDTMRFKQILSNILGNAVKFTSEGSIAIRVNSEAADPGKIKLNIEIEDSGIGLSEDEALKLFVPFSQADQSTTRKFGGTGLGLDLSRKLARALGGDVILSAFKLGQGCTFCVNLLVDIADDPSSYVTLDPALLNLNIQKPPQLSQLRALFQVEDALENQFLITEILSEHGLTIDIANNGKEALDHVARASYDFVLMDMQMPILDGYEATRELRKLGYLNPILALTALAFEADTKKIMEAGCDAHLTKPINFPALFETLSKLTSKRPI